MSGAGALARLRGGETLGAAVGLGPAALDAIYGHAHALFQRGLYEEAERFFTALSLLDHNALRTWLGLAACRQHRRAFLPALAAYRMALALAEDPRAALHYAECALALDMADDAKTALDLAARWSDRPEFRSVHRRAAALAEGLARRQAGAAPAGS